MFVSLGVCVTGCRPTNDEVRISDTVTLEGERIESGVLQSGYSDLIQGGEVLCPKAQRPGCF